MRKMRFMVKGLHCAGCAARAEKIVRQLPGASEVSMNFASRMLTLNASGDLDAETVIRAVRDGGYDAEELREHEVKNITEEELTRAGMIRFLTALVFSILLLCTAMCGKFSHGQNFLLQLILLIPVLIAGGRFYRSGFRSLFRLNPDMDSLIALSTSGAVIYSLFHYHEGALFFDTAGMIITLIMFGKLLEAKSRDRATSAIRDLMNLTPQTAHLVCDGEETEIPAAQLEKDDLVRIRPGEKIPSDGIIVEGNSFADESLLTGESMPVAKKNGDPVTGGSINGNGVLLCRITRTGEETVISQIIALIRDAQGTKPPAARLADIVAGYFVWGVIAVAAMTFAVWFFLRNVPFGEALGFTLAVLVVACPCALGLATPIALIVGIGRGAGLGILIRNGTALETAASVDVAAFDKTGTVTAGHPSVVKILAETPWTEETLLETAASAESVSEHPLAKAVVLAAEERKLPVRKGESFENHPGQGISIQLDGRKWLLGKDDFLRKNGITVPDSPFAGSEICIAAGGIYAGRILIQDPVRTEARTAILALHRMGIRSVMLTGDREESAAEAAKELGIDEFHAGLLPRDKYDRIVQLQQEGHSVAMAGDGINDAPALSRADVGIALRSGSDIAMKSAGIILMQNDLRMAAKAIALSRAVMRIIRENLFWAFFYNVICIPLAAGVFYPLLGWKFSPVAGAAAMAFSSVTVVLNALRLRRFKG